MPGGQCGSTPLQGETSDGGLHDRINAWVVLYQPTELAYLQRHVQICACLSTMQDVWGCIAGHDAALHTYLYSLPTGDSVGIIRSPRHVFLFDGADSAFHRCVGP